MNAIHGNVPMIEPDENDEVEPEGSSNWPPLAMFKESLSYLALDVFLVFFLWNFALVDAVEGVHKIGILGALGIIFLARSISRG